MSPAPATPAAPAVTAPACPKCEAPTSGRFCAECGTPVGDARCASCDSRLTTGARFCHRCGLPAGAAAQSRTAPAVPWIIAALSVAALVFVLLLQRGSAAPGAAPPPAAPPAADARGGGTPPDLTQMSPRDAADRLFDRIMRLEDEGKRDSVAFFAPMAITAYAAIGPLDADGRFHLGAVAIATGDPSLTGVARAQADSILAQRPTHLLGLILAAQSATIARDEAARRTFQRRLLAAQGQELALPLDEYLQHRPVIDNALRLARATP